ncbi:MAG: acetolactate synthase small subunit [Rhizomicrobium sp.]
MSVAVKVPKIERHTIAVLVDNEAGVLARVVGLFSGRGYNIESLTVAEVDHAAHTSRITVVTSGHTRSDRADRGAVAPAGAGAPRRQLDDLGAGDRARDGAGEGGRHR